MKQKLLNSRIIKFSLISIGVVLFIKILSLGIILYIVEGLKQGTFPMELKDILLRIVEVVNVSSIGAIGTIATAVIARYGIREATGNLSSNGKVDDKTIQEVAG